MKYQPSPAGQYKITAALLLHSVLFCKVFCRSEELLECKERKFYVYSAVGKIGGDHENIYSQCILVTCDSYVL